MNKTIQGIISPLILSYLKTDKLNSHQLVSKIYEEHNRFITPMTVDILIDMMRHEEGICTEIDEQTGQHFHYIPQDKPVHNIMLTTIVIGVLFIWPIITTL